MPRNRPRILIADDHTLVAELCKKLLATEFDVVGIVDNGRALIRAAARMPAHLSSHGLLLFLPTYRLEPRLRWTWHSSFARSAAGYMQ